MKAFLLAAGFGTRLRPLSELVPKPLWSFFEVPIAARALFLLEEAGVTEAVVNLHHLADRLHFGLEPWVPEKIDVRWSRETEILGTAGALNPWKKWLASDSFFLLNSDTYQEADLSAMAVFHGTAGGIATLLLRRTENSAAPIEIDGDGRIVRFLSQRVPGTKAGLPCEFTGVHIINPEALSYIPSGKSCINADVHARLAGMGAPLFGYVPDDDAYWSDLGTVGRYIQAHKDLLAKGKIPARSPGVLFLEDCELPSGGKIAAPAYLGRGTVLEAGAAVGPNAVVGARVWVAKGCTVENSIVWADCRVGSGFLSECIVSGDGVLDCSGGK